LDANVENQDEGDSPRVVEHGFGALLLELVLYFLLDLGHNKANF